MYWLFSETMAQIIDGKGTAQVIRTEIAGAVATLKEKTGMVGPWEIKNLAAMCFSWQVVECCNLYLRLIGKYLE